MPNPIAQLINGNRFDFSSIEIVINGITYAAVQEITYSHSLEPGQLRGTRADKLGRTRGQYDSEGSITMYKGDYQQMISALALVPPLLGGYMEKSFLVNVTYSEIQSGELVVDVLQGCRIVSDEDSHTQGSDALQVTANLDIMKLLRNGIPPVAPTALIP